MTRDTSRRRALVPVATALTGATVLLAGCAGSDTTTQAGAGHGGHVAASATATSTAATASPSTAQPSTAQPSTAQPSTAQAEHNDADVMFAQMMTPHHQQAMEMADLAASRAASPQVQRLAEKIKAAQGPEIAQMHEWLSLWGEPFPMDSDHAGHGPMAGMMTEEDMEALARAKGRDFDRRFLTMMITHHRGAVEMAQIEATEGRNPEAKALAQRVVADQQREIEDMERMLRPL